MHGDEIDAAHVFRRKETDQAVKHLSKRYLDSGEHRKI